MTSLAGHGYSPDTVFGGDTGLSNTPICFSSQLHLWMGWWPLKTARGTSIYSSGWTPAVNRVCSLLPAAFSCSWGLSK